MDELGPEFRELLFAIIIECCIYVTAGSSPGPSTRRLLPEKPPTLNFAAFSNDSAEVELTPHFAEQAPLRSGICRQISIEEIDTDILLGTVGVFIDVGDDLKVLFVVAVNPVKEHANDIIVRKGTPSMVRE